MITDEPSRRVNRMNPKHSKTSVRIRVSAAITCLAFFAGCATTPRTAGRLQYAPAAGIMREARSSQVPVEKRAADYLQAAAMTAPLLGTGVQETPARDTYNAACGELTVLLRSGEGGRLWNNSVTSPLTIRPTICAFNLPVPTFGRRITSPHSSCPASIKEKLIKKENIQARRRWRACWSAQCYSA